MKKCLPSKNPKNEAPGKPGTSKIDKKRTRENSKNPKIAKKTNFLTEPFFEWFLEREKPLGLKKTQWGWPRPGLKNYVSV